jgi:hypothetical protein
MIYGSMAYHDFYDLSPNKNTLVMIALRIHHFLPLRRCLGCIKTKKYDIALLFVWSQRVKAHWVTCPLAKL